MIVTTKENIFFDIETNALNHDWLIDDGEEFWLMDVWCNPPHSKTKAFVLKAHEQWKKTQHQHNDALCRQVYCVGNTSRRYLKSL